MALQIFEYTAAVADNLTPSIFDAYFIVDDDGNRTDEIRIGDSRTRGGVILSGGSFSSGVASWNGLVGAVSAASTSLTDVSVTVASQGQVLIKGLGGSMWTPVDAKLAFLTDVSATAPGPGQVLAWNEGAGEWEPTTATLTGDNLGDHTATTTLEMNGNQINDLGQVNFNTSWKIQANGNATNGSFYLYQGDISGANLRFGMLYDDVRQVCGFLFYGSSRVSDVSVSSPLDNLCYYDPFGSFQKARLNQLPLSSLKIHPFDGGGAGAPVTNSIMYFDGAEWVSLPPGGDNDTLRIIGGVPTWN